MTEKNIEGGEKRAEKTKVSPKTLEREAATTLTALSTLIKPKQKRKRKKSMYFKARKSTRIKSGKPQPSSKLPITIEDSPTIKGEESPSKTPITYESGTPRSSIWKEKVQLQDSKTVLKEAQIVLQETWSRLQEAKKT